MTCLTTVGVPKLPVSEVVDRCQCCPIFNAVTHMLEGVETGESSIFPNFAWTPDDRPPSGEIDDAVIVLTGWRHHTLVSRPVRLVAMRLILCGLS